MPATPRLSAFGVPVAAVVLLLALPSVRARPAAGSFAAAVGGASVGPSSIFAGAGGRVALRRWVLRLDPGDVGGARGWARHPFPGQRVSVPHVANPGPISGPGSGANYRGSIAWYETDFRAARAGIYVLHFESANHRASVWLDGRSVGTHTGEFLPFEFRVHCGVGAHRLAVRTDWRDPPAQTAEGFHRTWFNFGGLNREVSIRPQAASEIEDPTLVTRLSPGAGGPTATVHIGMVVRNHGAARDLAVRGSLTGAAGSVVLATSPVHIDAHAAAVVSAQVSLPRAALWTPGHPALYGLSLSTADGYVYRARVGLREVSWSSGRLYLNGRRLRLHGASLQEDAPGVGDGLSGPQQDALVGELRGIGANAARSQHPLDPGLLERLDAAGMVVWQGVGPADPSGGWTAHTDALRARAQQRVRTSVRQDQLHPSVIAWNLVNELAGNGQPGGQVDYVAQTAAWVHRVDPGRLVALDVWGTHPPRRRGAIYRSVDAVTETDYAGWYELTGARAAAIDALMRRRLAALDRLFSDKVRLISEFGAEGDGRNRPFALGGYAEQAHLVGLHLSAYARDPALSGMLVWVLRDFALSPAFAGGTIRRRARAIRLVAGLNEKGLFTYAGRPKPASALVRRAYGALGAF